MKIGSIYRFGDNIAVYNGSGETRYIPIAEAKAMKHALDSVIHSLETEPNFSKSTVGTFAYCTYDLHEVIEIIKERE